MRTFFALWLAGALGFAANVPAPRKRSFGFEYAATVKGVPTGAHTVDIWLPAPHDDTFQRVTNLRVDTPYRYEIATGTVDNHILPVRVTEPKEPAIAVTMRFDAVRREHLQPLAVTSSANGAAAPRRLAPLDGTIRRRAREVVDAAGAKTDLEMARAVGIPARFAPLNYFVYPYVELDGGKYTSVDISYSYKDLPL